MRVFSSRFGDPDCAGIVWLSYNGGRLSQGCLMPLICFSSPPQHSPGARAYTSPWRSFSAPLHVPKPHPLPHPSPPPEPPPPPVLSNGTLARLERLLSREGTVEGVGWRWGRWFWWWRWSTEGIFEQAWSFQSQVEKMGVGVGQRQTHRFPPDVSIYTGVNPSPQSTPPPQLRPAHICDTGG